MAKVEALVKLASELRFRGLFVFGLTMAHDVPRFPKVFRIRSQVEPTNIGTNRVQSSRAASRQLEWNCRSSGRFDPYQRSGGIRPSSERLDFIGELGFHAFIPDLGARSAGDDTVAVLDPPPDRFPGGADQ